MKLKSFNYILVLSMFCGVSIMPAMAQEGGFMFESGGTEPAPSELNTAGGERSYTSGAGSSRSRHHVTRTNTTPTENEKESKKPQTSEVKKATPSKAAAATLTKPKENPAPTEKTTTEEEDPDSVVSFNFLHYIIQKFKFSEMIDE